MHPASVRWLALLALATLLAPPAAAHPRLQAVVPDLPSHAGDGGVAITADSATDLTGYALSDGHHTWVIPAGNTGPGASAWFVANATRWAMYGGPPPVATWKGLALGASKGSLRLLDPAGAVNDAFAWGNTSVEGMPGMRFTSPGLLYERAAGPDADTLGDWIGPRVHRIGESTLGPRTATVAHATLYASPDNSYAVLTNLIARSTTRLQVHVYMLTSWQLTDALVAAKRAHPDLRLEVLVDAQPVGLQAADRHREADALRRIQDAGGSVVLAGGGAARYAHNHLKVLVADDAVAVQSENWGETGVPADPSWGNRGWGVVLRDAPTADWFATWLAADRSAWDAHPFALDAFDPAYAPPPREAPRTGSYTPVQAPLELSEVTVRIVVSPDMTFDPSSDPVDALVAQARTSVAAQQLELSGGARNALGYSAPDAFAQAVRQAARSGAAVRVVHAPAFDGSEDATGPTSPAKVLDGVPGVEVRAGQRDGIVTWHNKGIVVDGRWVVVGSMNAVHASRSANREVDVILDSAEAARYAAALFDADWNGSTPDRDWGVPAADARGLGMAPLPILFGAMGVAAMLVRKR